MLRGHFVLLLSLGLPLSSVAQTARSEPTTTAEVSKFVMGTRLGYITCSEKYKTYLEKWELYALMTEGQREPKARRPRSPTYPTAYTRPHCAETLCTKRLSRVLKHPRRNPPSASTWWPGTAR